MAEVVTLRGEAVRAEPDADLVEHLEALLARARAGDLRAVAYATVDDAGTAGSGWSGVFGTRHPLGSAVLMLSHRYAAALLPD